MVFSSQVFLTVFLPVTVILYYLIPSLRWKNVLLLACSLVFYAWGEPVYVFLMAASILVNYSFGRLIHHARHRRAAARSLLILAVLFNLGLLLYFKYFNFLVDSLNKLLSASISAREIALPIGISFFTFQGLSYVIDVYREDPAEESSFIVQRDFIDLALYIAMFPQLIAGPIVRYHDIQPYLRGRTHSTEQFARGIETFVGGLAKKVLVANVLGETVELIMVQNVNMIDAPIAWLGAVCYSLQLYFDFSGYSDMAIGMGRMFGFEFQRNFDDPYVSTSITEFWRRWHLSLSQWFRDYLYIPLGGSRRGNVYFNLFVVFLATGIWHGAAFGFILWGLWHGMFVLLERFHKKHPISGLKLPAPVRWLWTMLIVVLGWTLFRLVSVTGTLRYYSIMFGLSKPDFLRFGLAWYLPRRTLAALAAAVLLCLPWRQLGRTKLAPLAAFLRKPVPVLIRRSLALLLLGLCFLAVCNSTYNPFIYFRF